MAQDDLQVRGAGDARRVDIAARSKGEHLAADDPTRVAPQHQRHGDDDVPDRRLQKGGQHDDEGQEGNAEGDVGQPHQHRIDPAAEIAGNQPDDGADESDHEGRGDADQQG